MTVAGRAGHGHRHVALQLIRRETYLAAVLTSIFLTGSFFSVWRATETVRMPSW